MGAPVGGTIAGLAEPVVKQHDDASTASSVDTSDEDDDGGDCDDESIDCGMEFVDGGSNILFQRKLP